MADVGMNFAVELESMPVKFNLTGPGTNLHQT